MATIPYELLYTDQHEWLRVEGDSATVGITDYAQEHLGDITFVELPAVGAPIWRQISFAGLSITIRKVTFWSSF